MIFTLRMLESFAPLGLSPGNLVTVEPGAQAPWHAIYMHRPFPANYGLIVDLLADGVAELLSPDQSVDDLAQAVGWPLRHPRAPAPGGGSRVPAPRRASHLIRVK